MGEIICFGRGGVHFLVRSIAFFGFMSFRCVAVGGVRAELMTGLLKRAGK